MTFHSILFEEPNATKTVEAPDCFGDLNLDRIIDAVTADWKDYDLKPFYYAPLNDLGAIAYRQEVMQDFEDQALMQGIKSFSERMRGMRVRRNQSNDAKKSGYKYAMERLFLGAVEIYCEAVEFLLRDLCALDIKSRGLRVLREYLKEYLASVSFRNLAAETRKLSSDLSGGTYCLLLKDGSVTVRSYSEESDYSSAVEEIFEKFRRDAARRFRLRVEKWQGMNHIEAQVQDRVALLYPDLFRALDSFYLERAEYLDEKVARFDREIQFYAAYLDHIERFRGAGLAFCYPRLSDQHKDVVAREAFDLALAERCLEERMPIVCNDIVLQGPERVCVVTGPNQGGKTTFARTVGQLHYLASLGCPVPGREARLFLYDRLFTHFGREEEIARQRGGLEDDLVRIHAILNQATPNSLLIINEIFSSTTLEDALYLGREVLTRIMRLDLLCVYVTFLDELSTLSEKTVSLVAAVDPEDPVRRTFRVERRKAHGLAYALAIAEKYRVTRRWLEERIRT